MVGNKSDLKGERCVELEEVREQLKLAEGKFMEVSAKTGDNLETLFRSACEEMLKSNDCESTVSRLNPNSIPK